MRVARTLCARPIPGFRMPPRQTGTPRSLVMYAARFAVPSDPAELDVDDAARADGAGLARDIGMGNGFVKADVRCNSA